MPNSNPVTQDPEDKIHAPKPRRVRFNSTDDYTEVAAYMLGYSEEEYEKAVNDLNEEEIEEKLYDKFNVGIGELGAIIEALLPMTMPQEKAVKGELVHVFGVFEPIGFRSICEHTSTKLMVVESDSENKPNEEAPK